MTGECAECGQKKKKNVLGTLLRSLVGDCRDSPTFSPALLNNTQQLGTASSPHRQSQKRCRGGNDRCAGGQTWPSRRLKPIRQTSDQCYRAQLHSQFGARRWGLLIVEDDTNNHRLVGFVNTRNCCVPRNIACRGFSCKLHENSLQLPDHNTKSKSVKKTQVRCRQIRVRTDTVISCNWIYRKIEWQTDVCQCIEQCTLRLVHPKTLHLLARGRRDNREYHADKYGNSPANKYITNDSVIV